MVVNDNAANLTPTRALGFIASELAPTGNAYTRYIDRSGTSPQGRRRQWNNKNNHCEGYRYVRKRSNPGSRAQRGHQPGNPESHLRLVPRDSLRVV
ncbi:hypothetical protein B0D71_04805 [Pseudomonas laurylsulfativorans]|uniref:Uncharacterized protein n=1 Tax=Pseudomonas laurylsulfativorans TaxID=1943631 RepID=A0A2S3VVZ4_9PSED|nr:hypothetical protein B0D71_04805 [Pseudomonas laurylsulfativorans]